MSEGTVYDLDTSGGLMEQIQKLVAPPQSEQSSSVKKKRVQPERNIYRRPKNAVNHDCCDSCKEGGDLLCCDRCPAAFHLLCHDPPLFEDDLPTGEWICYRCKIGATPESMLFKEKEDDAGSTCSSRSSMSRRGATSRGPVIEEDVASVDSDEYDEDTGPFAVLIKAAKKMNPKQFDVPKQMTCHHALPGTSKRKWGKEGNGRNAKKAAHELDNGLVPLPAKVCFICSRSCRKAPLLQCDYCPLLFHLDCLNPPLTSMPSGRWMCPNHAENLMDEKMLKSVGLTERVKLWDKFSGPLNQQATKITFLKKAHRQNPPFRIKVKHSGRKNTKIPQAIKDQYRLPPPLLPLPVEKPEAKPDTSRTSTPPPETSLEDQEEWLSSVVALQSSITQYLAQKQIRKSRNSSSKSEPSHKPTASVLPTIKQERSDTPSPTPSNSSICSMGSIAACSRVSDQGMVNGTQESDVTKTNGPISLLNHNQPGASNGEPNTDVRLTHEINKSKSDSSIVGKPVPTLVKISSSGSVHSGKSIVVNTMSKHSTPLITKVVTSALKSNPTSILTPRVVVSGSGKATIPNKVTVVSGPGGSGTSRVITVSAPASARTSCSNSISSKSSAVNTLSTSPAILNLNNTLQACIDGNAEAELSKIDERLVQILAYQRLQQLLPQKHVGTTGKKGLLNGLLSPSGSNDVQARALLCPLTGRGQPIPMPYRTLNIGTGGNMDVCLTSFGHCNYISPKHACIFYDETSRHFELLNYSEHGTTVDNVLYSCDFSEKLATTPQPTPLVKSVRDIIDKHRNLPPVIPAERQTMSQHANQVFRPCNCRTSSSSLIGGSGAGWEGTALLHHGSYVKVGCIQFVFSIVDQAPEIVPPDVKREGFSILKSSLRPPSP